MKIFTYASAILVVVLFTYFVILVIKGPNHTRVFSTPPLRDYQIELHMDTVWLYDGDRLVGSYISTWTNQIDTLITKDNQ